MPTYIVHSKDKHDSGGEIEAVELITTSRARAYQYIKKRIKEVLDSEDGYYLEDDLAEPETDREVEHINDNLIDEAQLDLGDGFSYIQFKLFKLKQSD